MFFCLLPYCSSIKRVATRLTDYTDEGSARSSLHDFDNFWYTSSTRPIMKMCKQEGGDMALQKLGALFMYSSGECSYVARALGFRARGRGFEARRR